MRPPRQPRAVEQGLEQIIQQRALARAHEHLHRHAGAQRRIANAAQLTRRHIGAQAIVGTTVAVIIEPVRRHQRHGAFQSWRAAGIKGGEHQLDRQACAHLVDGLHRQAPLDHQRHVVGHDLHQARTRLHHAAHRVRGQRHHGAADRGADLAVRQIEFRRRQFLRQLFALHAGLRQIGAHLALECVAALLAAQRQFRDLLAGLAQRAPVRGHVTVQLRQAALQVQHPVARHVAFARQIAQVADLFPQQGALRALVRQRRFQAGGQGPASGQRRVDASQLARQRRPPAGEQLTLHRVGGRHFGVRLSIGRRKIIAAIALGQQARFAGHDRRLLRAQALRLATHPGVVQPHQRLAGPDLVAFGHQQGAHHAALDAVHRLPLAGHDHDAGHRHAVVQRRPCRPCQETAKAQRQHPPAEAGRPAAMVFGIDRARIALVQLGPQHHHPIARGAPRHALPPKIRPANAPPANG